VIWAGRRSDKKFAAEKEERATAPSSLAKTPASVDLEAIAKLVADRRGESRAGPIVV